VVVAESRACGSDLGLGDLGAAGWKMAFHDIAVDVAAVLGDPAEKLIDLSDQLDVLVCGSRGHGPVRAVLLGSVSRRLVAEAHCPVIVLPRRDEDASDRAPERRGLRGRQAVVAYRGRRSAGARRGPRGGELSYDQLGQRPKAKVDASPPRAPRGVHGPRVLGYPAGPTECPEGR
jgi:hypothetical protein